MKTFGLFIVLLGWSVAYASPAPTSGAARCADSAEKAPAPCRVTWAWDEQPRAYQWVQVFVPEQGVWLTTAETRAARSGISADPVREGNIFRVRSCNRGDAATECINSTVAWAPYQPRESDISEFVVDSHGIVISISKSLPYFAKVITFNHVRLREWFYDVSEPTALPQMSAPLRTYDKPGWTDWDNLTENVYEFYQMARLPQPEMKKDPSDPPDYVGDVPPEARDKFRADALADVRDSDSIVYEPATMKHKVTVFADINCGHCRKMVLQDMDELMSLGIRVRLIAFPLAGESSPTAKVMSEVWCASDRKEAFKRAAVDQPVGSPPCRSTIVHQYALARRLGLGISPGIVAENGEILGGYLAPQDLLRVLETRKTASLR